MVVSPLAVGALLVAAVANGVSALPDVVPTSSGDVRGFLDVEAHALVFRGIPYAATTGMANRFRPPQPRAAWSGVLNCTAFGPGCAQPDHNLDVPTLQSEDCLNLNVYVPDDAGAVGPLPVAVFFHGGAFKEGSNRGPMDLYQAGRFVNANEGRNPVIAVEANYRLNALGSLVISKEEYGDTGINGNFALMDQRAALQWIKDNAAAFGGDPDRVILWGESAGAMSVGIHTVSPLSAGLFHAAIMESNPAGYRYKTTKDAELYGKYFVKAAGCAHDGMKGIAVLDCLQGLNVSQLHKAADKAENDVAAIVVGNWQHYLDAFLTWTPTVTGDEQFPATPQAAYRAGNFTKVPMLAGYNQDEGATFIYAGLKQPVSSLDYEAAVLGLFGVDAGSKVLKRYSPPSDNGADCRDVASKMLTDYWFKCGTQKLAATNAAAGQPTFVYRFDHVISWSNFFTHCGLPLVCANRTCHATELPFVFSQSANQTFTSAEQSLASEFGSFWTSFVRNNHPSAALSDSGSQWPLFDATNRTNVVLTLPKLKVESIAETCAFWDSIGYDH